jgi:hypothetical protein
VTDQQQTEYVEFIGWPPNGAEFISKHIVPAKHMEDVHDVKTTKDLVWTKGANGRMLLPTADVDPKVLAYLKTDPAFKVVRL